MKELSSFISDFLISPAPLACSYPSTPPASELSKNDSSVLKGHREKLIGISGSEIKSLFAPREFSFLFSGTSSFALCTINSFDTLSCYGCLKNLRDEQQYAADLPSACCHICKMWTKLKELQPTKTKCAALAVFVSVELAPPIGKKVFAATIWRHR